MTYSIDYRKIFIQLSINEVNYIDNFVRPLILLSAVIRSREDQ